jgi:hypothetical protein
LCCALLAALLTGGCVTAAFAGAWLMPPGEGQVIVYSAFSNSTRAFDNQGHLIAVPDYRKFELGTYVEYGLTSFLTLVASPSYDRIKNPPPGQSYAGPGESELAARLGLYRSDNTVVSLQAGIRSPGGSLADSLGPFAVRRTVSFDVRGMAGRSGVFLGMEAFAEAQAGYRFYAGGQPGEWHFDLTAGVRPLPRLLVMLQSFTTISNGSTHFGHYSWTKLQPSVVLGFAPQWSLQIGGFITVAGVNAGRELGPIAGIWYRF